MGTNIANRGTGFGFMTDDVRGRDHEAAFAEAERRAWAASNAGRGTSLSLGAIVVALAGAVAVGLAALG